MGRDDHKRSKNNFLSQTPKNQKSDGRDIEFAEEFADHEDKEAQARSRAADKRAKKK
ncbi:YfhD family protein [Virgibacillus kimchii]